MINRNHISFTPGYNYDPGEGCTPGVQAQFYPEVGGVVVLSLWDEVGDCVEVDFSVGELFGFLKGFMGVVEGEGGGGGV